MKIKNIFPFAASALLLASCGIYNKYERPEVNAQGLIRDVQSDTDTLAVADTTSFGNLPWRQVFTDPQLQSLIETSLAHNTDYLNCALNVKMVEAQLTMASCLQWHSLHREPFRSGMATRHPRFTLCRCLHRGQSISLVISSM